MKSSPVASVSIAISPSSSKFCGRSFLYWYIVIVLLQKLFKHKSDPQYYNHIQMYIPIIKNLRCALILISLTSCQSLNIQTLSSDEPPKEEVQSLEEYESRGHLYEVLRTDTIVSIARKKKVTPEQIIDLNNIRKPYVLKPGQLLKIPATPSYKDNTEDNSVQEVWIAPRRH